MSHKTQQTIKNLQSAIEKQDHNEAYQYSKILLKQSPEDEEYQQCLIISALKINLFDELEQFFKTNPIKQSIQELYAYYLYDIGDYPKTIATLQSLMNKKSKNQKAIASYKLLLTQTYFKMNDSVSSAKLMLELIQSSKLPKEDLQMYLINLFATSINKQLDEGIVARYKNITKDNFCKDVYYNYALLLIALEDYIGGLENLKMFQDGLQKGKDDQDIHMITVLKDYVHYKQLRNGHKMDEEMDKIKQYQKMQEQVQEVNLMSVIKNNLVFFKYQNNEHLLENYHEIIKIIDEGLDKKSKMTKPQQFILKLNKFTLFLRKNRFSEATKILKDLETNFQPQTFLNNNINFFKGKYTLLKKTKDTNSNVDILGYIKSLEKNHKNLAFCLLADLKRGQNKQTQLIDELKVASHSPIIKNFIFSLLIKNTDLFEQYHEYLDELLQKTNDIKILDILLRLYESKEDLAKQQAVLTKILKINNKDVNSKVKMASIYLNQGQINKAQELLRGVEQPQEISDINYLQNIEKNIHISTKREDEFNQPVFKINNKVNDKKQVQIHQVEKKRIKKTRKPRYPKNMEKCIEGFKGDPERWLPKWQRKGYKKKGKKGAGKTQGLATVSKQQTKNIFTTNASTSSKQVTKQSQKKRK